MVGPIRAQELETLRALARTREILAGIADWAAWEREMQTPDVPQDAIEYMRGE